MSNVAEFPGSKRVQPFESFSPTEWHGRQPPALDWMVENCVLRGTVAMLSGDGGLGKSLLMQQLLTAAAVGSTWLGLNVQRCKSFGFFCEDDKDELWRRQEAINEHYGVQMGDLDNVEFISRVGMENVLMEFDRRTDAARPTPLFDQLRQRLADCGSQLIVLDTLADVFAGNEIIRNQVRRFISALRKIAMERQGAVILTAHPSNAGLTSGTGISGSTAWNNSVRARLYLTRPRRADEMEDEDDDIRVLKTMKANQAKAGGKIEVRWERGVFVRLDQQPQQTLDAVGRIDLKVSVHQAIAQLCRNGTRMSPDRFARTYVVAAVLGHPLVKRFTRGQIEGAKDALLSEGKLVIVTVRRDRKDRQYIRTHDMVLPEEGETA